MRRGRVTKRQFGTVRRLPSGRWQARYRDVRGRMVTAPRTFAAKADAHRFLSTVEADMLRGTYVDPRLGRETLAVYAERWMADRVKLRPKTRGLYRLLLDRCILPTLGPGELGRLTPSTVRSWHADLISGQRCGPSMVPKAYRLLRTILTTAVADEILVRNPCTVKGAGVERAPERKVASVAQVYEAAAAVPARHRVLVLMAALSGLREGELFALTRARVDLLHGTVEVVVQQVEPDHGPRHIGEPKTDAGRRTVSLPPTLMPELEEHLARWVAPGRDSLVFTAPHGGPLNRSNFNRTWRRVRAATGLPQGFTFHDLRHTASNLAAASGASTAELMARMGHSSPRAALRYQHATRARDAVIAVSAAVDASAPAVPTAPVAAISGGSGTGVARKGA